MNNQHGFRHRRSCLTGFLTLMKKGAVNLDGGKPADVLFYYIIGKIYRERLELLGLTILEARRFIAAVLEVLMRPKRLDGIKEDSIFQV